MTAKKSVLDHFLGENGLFHQNDPMNPPSVIHGWKATDLLSQMVKRKNYLLNPISRQNFADALAENHNLKLEVCHMNANASKLAWLGPHISSLLPNSSLYPV